MADFIKFNEDKVRDDFFVAIKTSFGKSWKQMILEAKIPRSSLDCYKLGHAIPEPLFLKLLEYLPKIEREQFAKEVRTIDSREWLSQGCKEAYKINFDKFAEGRVKGLNSIRRMGKKPKTFNFPEFKASQEICPF